MESSFQHHFLIAMPSLADSFFYRSLVYICEHDKNGAMGLIVNRPTQIMLEELLSHLDIQNPSKLPQKLPVLFGGPVQKGQGMIIHDSPANWNSSIQLADNMFLTTSTDILESIGTSEGPDHTLITLGYAGWGKGQLEQELAENSWLTVPANTSILFNTSADKRWQAAAQLLGIDINLMTDTVGHA
ncbi:MAG: YqgE/AlgH family protein [Methylophaga sp.]|nr:MAG: YqgE/AlgH family protein [Methylophaga sp.]